MGQIAQCEREIEECVGCDREAGISVFDLAAEEPPHDLEDALARKLAAPLNCEAGASPSFVPPLYPPDSRPPAGSPLLNFCEKNDASFYVEMSTIPASSFQIAASPSVNFAGDHWAVLPVERMSEDHPEKRASFKTEVPSDYGGIYRLPEQQQHFLGSGYSIDSRPLPPPPPRIAVPPKPPPSAPSPYPCDDERPRPSAPSFQAKFDDLVCSAVLDSAVAIEGGSSMLGLQESLETAWASSQHDAHACPHCKRCPVCGQSPTSGTATPVAAVPFSSPSGMNLSAPVSNMETWEEHLPASVTVPESDCVPTFQATPAPGLAAGSEVREPSVPQDNRPASPTRHRPLYEDPGRPLFGPWPPKLLQTPDCGSPSHLAAISAPAAAPALTAANWCAAQKHSDSSTSPPTLPAGQQAQWLLPGPLRGASTVVPATPKSHSVPVASSPVALSPVAPSRRPTSPISPSRAATAPSPPIVVPAAAAASVVQPPMRVRTPPRR